MASEPEPSNFNPLTVSERVPLGNSGSASDIKLDDGATNLTLSLDEAKQGEDQLTIGSDPEPKPNTKLDILGEYESDDSLNTNEKKESPKFLLKDQSQSSPTYEGDNKEPITDEKEDIKTESLEDQECITNEQKFIRRLSNKDRYSFAIPHNSPTVLKAELGGNWLTRHILFVVMLTNGEWVRRRFNDFLWLRTQLRKIYLGAFIPPLPERLPIALWPKGHLKTRKQELQLFLKRCSISSFISDEPTWKFFFQKTGHGTFEKARKRWDKGHTAPSYSQICEHLETTFPITKEPLPDLTEQEMEEKFVEMHQFIQEITRGFQRIYDSSKRMADTFVLKVDSLMEVQESLQEYDTILGTKFADENQDERVRLLKVFPVNITNALFSWCQAMQEVPSQYDALLVHSMKRHMMEFKVLEECFADRFLILKNLNTARSKAAKWEKIKELRAKDVPKKSADLYRKEELETLSKLLYKIITNHYDSIWQTSQHDFIISVKRLINMHIKKYGQLEQIWSATVKIFQHKHFRHVSD